MRRCLNPSVLAGLALVAAGIYVFAPELFLAALPLLILAACAVGVGVMMWMMRGQGAAAASATGAPSATIARSSSGAEGDGSAAGSVAAVDSPEDYDERDELEHLRARVAEFERSLRVASREASRMAAAETDEPSHHTPDPGDEPGGDDQG